MKLKEKSGQATLEFALILPMFVLLGLLLFQVGIIVKTKILLTYATSRAADAVLEIPKNEEVPPTLFEAETIARQTVANTFGAKNIAVSVKRTNSNFIEITLRQPVQILISNKLISTITLTETLTAPFP